MPALQDARNLASLVRLSHTIFGLPFALAAALLAHRYALENGRPGLTWATLAWILLAFTAARTAAMAFNRIVDRHIDARNPRTAGRELPAGKVSVASAWALTVGSAALFWLAAAALGPVPARLAPLCLPIILGYSLVKRVSWAAHLVLGLALALAPGGAWVAVTGGLDGWRTPAWLMLAVASWVAGFDVLYSLQDREIDLREGLHSIPAAFGVPGALVLSGALHVVTAGTLLALQVTAGLGLFHLVGVAAIVVILLYEHAIVRPSDLSRIDRAFFDLNGYISLVYLACTFLDLWTA